MNDNHIIIGYGNWAKKIINFLKKRNFFSKIYIKTRNKYYEHGKNGNISKKKFLDIKYKINSVHICSPVNTHFDYLSRLTNFKKIIVEKPFLKNLVQLKKIQRIYSNSSLIFVNYTYLFSPILSKLKKYVNKKSNEKIIINFSKKNTFYKKKYDCIYDWLDHPLSIILYLFNNFSKFKILKKEFTKKRGFYEKVIINYYYKNLIVQIKINTSKINKKNITIINNSKKIICNFNNNSIFSKNKRLFKSNKSSFEMLYYALKNNKKISFQNFNFHKKIIIEKSKIMKKIKNDSKLY
tara:strand:- start:3510 stop:4391 length:882 start_codon:yes stop_codon:yes gene_type:complete